MRFLTAAVNGALHTDCHLPFWAYECHVRVRLGDDDLCDDDAFLLRVKDVPDEA